MLSLVLYGRNDNYGYNLHKRAALSLNCMAEILTHPDDEILFVDYNTPDDYPTFPEAIADTLTKKAKSRLRIFRVRPETHRQRFAARTHLKALEPVARNVAIRRSNAGNRWILSTNTDMIFALRTEKSLSDIAERLEDGIYCAPRIELPETLWEGFDRLDPAAAIAESARCGREIHLNEIVMGADTILYDAPGDFQLMTRNDLFAYHAFHEGMLKGWHLDSNISKRLSLVYGNVGDAAPFVFGYHCDHTRQITPMHAHRSPENSIARYVDEVTEPGLPEQAESWGLADVDVEELSLGRSVNAQYLAVLRHEICRPLDIPLKVGYLRETYGLNSAPPEHILPFLLDIFASCARSDEVVWAGPRGQIHALFSASWKRLGFLGTIHAVDCGEDFLRLPEKTAAYIVNFGTPQLISSGDEENALLRVLWGLILLERDRSRRGQPLRRFICLNAAHNRFETVVLSCIGAGRTPFSTRIKHGFLLADVLDPTQTNEPVKDWTPRMRVGYAAKMIDGHITSDASEMGCVAFGPYECLLPGRYEVVVVIDVCSYDDSAAEHMEIETVFAEVTRTSVMVTFSKTGQVSVRLPIALDEFDFFRLMQIRVSRLRKASFRILSVKVAMETASARKPGPTPMRNPMRKVLSGFQIRQGAPDKKA